MKHYEDNPQLIVFCLFKLAYVFLCLLTCSAFE